jgi:hypothetical protein
VAWGGVETVPVLSYTRQREGSFGQLRLIGSSPVRASAGAASEEAR